MHDGMRWPARNTFVRAYMSLYIAYDVTPGHIPLHLCQLTAFAETYSPSRDILGETHKARTNVTLLAAHNFLLPTPFSVSFIFSPLPFTN